MDFDLLKQYKEYEELQAKLNPLKIEYNFLIEDIEKKKKEQSNISGIISSQREGLQIEKDLFEQEKSKFYAEIDEIRESMIRQINNETLKIGKELKDLIKSRDDLLVVVTELQSNKESIDKDVKELTKQLEILNFEKETNVEYIKTETNKLESLRKDTEKKIEQLQEKKTELDKTTNEHKIYLERYEKVVIELKTEQENIQKARYELEQKSLENDKKIELINISIEEKNKSINILNKKKEETEGILQELKGKEIEIAKKIADFQEEKYRFFVAMKQKDIKKSDLDKLEKDFTIN